MNDSLINGKDLTEKIEAIEVHDGYAEIFISGQDKPTIVSNKYWVLSNQALNRNAIRMKGNLHFKYGYQFSKRSDFMQFRMLNRKNDTYSIYDGPEATMINKGYSSFKGMKHNEVSVLSFDIETTGVELNEDSKVLLISNTFRDSKGNITRRLFAYDEHEDLFKSWSDWVRSVNPAILIAHNGSSFDLPYLDFCASKQGSSLPIGRDGSNLSFSSYESSFRKDSTQSIEYRKPRIYGRQFIDTYFLSLKYDIARKYESYGLKSIIKQEGLERPGREFYDASQIRNKYMIPEEWEKIKRYCVDDSDDSLVLYDLMIPPFFYMAQAIPKPFQAVIESASGSQINVIMVRSYLQEGHSIPKAYQTREYGGGISFGVPGIYKNVMKIDFSALYPSIMRQYKIYDPKKDPKAHFLHLVEYFTVERLKNKKLAAETGEKYYTHLEQSQKIVINSMYGFLAAQGLNFNNTDLADQITTKARELLKMSILWATSKDYDYWWDLFEKKTGVIKVTDGPEDFTELGQI